MSWTLALDHNTRSAVVNGRSVVLTNREFELLSHFAENKNRALPRESLFKMVWGYDMEFSSNSLDVYIYRIRRKIEEDPDNPKWLLTMRGYGYKFVSGSIS